MNKLKFVKIFEITLLVFILVSLFRIRTVKALDSIFISLLNGADLAALSDQLYNQRILIIFLISIIIILVSIFVWAFESKFNLRSTAKEKLNKKVRLEKMLADVSSSFVGSNADNLGTKLSETIELVGKEFDAERCYFIEFSEDRTKSKLAYEWCKKGVQPHKWFSGNVSLNDYPHFFSRGLNGEFIYIPDVSAMDKIDHVEKNMLLSLQINSVLAMPIMRFGQPRAYLGFDLKKVNRKFTDDEYIFLMLLANMISDALEKNDMEISLSTEKERLETTMAAVEDGIISVNVEGVIDYINPAAQELTAWERDLALGQHVANVCKIVYSQDRDTMVDLLNIDKKETQDSEVHDHKVLKSKRGMEIAVSHRASPIRDKLGRARETVLVLRDITEELIAKKRIEYLSFHDQLTGLYNRHFFEEELKRLDTTRNLPISILMADVNCLKLTNDAFGHEKGDELLKKAAEVLKGQCREDEIVTRVGGDEFVIILPKTDLFGAQRIADRIIIKSKEVFVGSVGLSLSIGCACKENPESDLRETMIMAEKLMYQHKLTESPRMRMLILETILNILKEKNLRGEEHSKRISDLSARLGLSMGLSQHVIEDLKKIGNFHDIGKIAIDDRVLRKIDQLTFEERQEIKRHPVIGYHVLNSIKDMADIAQIVLAHHERWDGNGYPKGLREEEIPIQARIASLVTVYDYIISEHPYRKALSQTEALEEIKKNAGTQFDPKVEKFFIEMLDTERE